jgi:nickel-dependent lactate racemase
MIYFGTGSENSSLGPDDLRKGLFSSLDKLGKKKKVLIVPPDFTRYHSGAGELTVMMYDYYRSAIKGILPALGTHSEMTAEEISVMFPGIPSQLFHRHDFRSDVVTLGTVPETYISSVSGGLLSYSWPVQVNRLIAEGGHDLIISVGQVVPHEVMGMAGYNKNILVGTGGAEAINKSHYLGAVYGMEKLMGKAENPVRSLLNYASDMFLKEFPVLYVLTVIGRDQSGKLVPKGLFIGDGTDAFNLAAELSVRVNFSLLPKAIKKCIVWLDPAEYRSTWLGNKSIYRTRMAIADGGELIVLAPGLKEFGEDAEIDRLIRKYGYKGTAATLRAVEENNELRLNLSAAAHLIHGSTEGRFKVTYCPGSISQEEIEAAGYCYAELRGMMKRYDPSLLKEGFNTLPGGEEIFFISNPATGLWASKDRIFN